ncbi:hypothetical protein RIF29_17981 [Crotalaria pallida]|uniref:Uncharacterized protein n=1 Tax=Crotalaria pallida TaxID=3830 RepID=A0AAN9IGY8_CROPI
MLASHGMMHQSQLMYVLTYLEKALIGVGNVRQGDNGNTTQHQSANLIMKSSVPNSASVADASNLDFGSNLSASENNTSGALSEDTLDYEAMLLDFTFNINVYM